jgi:1-acyl-sn-glycerol-3-phosphate acyltransferase
VAPGARREYQPGGAWIAVKTATPVVPVAHNSGEFWRRNAFLKHPGTITVSIGAPIETRGLAPEEVNRKVEDWIESEMLRISRDLTFPRNP